MCVTLCNSWETYSTFFAQSGGRLIVINVQLAMIVHMITRLNNLQTVVKEATCFMWEITLFFVSLIHGRMQTIHHRGCKIVTIDLVCAQHKHDSCLSD